MRRLLSAKVGGRLSMNFNVGNDNDLYFELVSGNNKIIAFIPVFTVEGAESMYMNLTNKKFGKAMRTYVLKLVGAKNRMLQSPDKR